MAEDWQDAGDIPGDHDRRTTDEEPIILSFPRGVERFGNGGSTDLITRARLLYSNRRCRFCGCPLVQPLTLDDVVLNRNRLPIPGTGTLVGFHCDRCRAQWTV